jgi:hypothetical protein
MTKASDEAMAEAVRLGLMSSSGQPTDRAQCRTCEAAFSTDGNFDRHLTKGRNAGDFDGLVQNAKGVWTQPGPAGRAVSSLYGGWSEPSQGQ